jgi:hypothetical protein
LKNEIKIITSPDELFVLWKEFLERHSTGALINPDTMEKFNLAKNFKVTKNFTLVREFFKPLGHLIDNDLKSLCNTCWGGFQIGSGCILR